MELTYHRKGDYLFPNLTVQDEPMSIGKYGMLRRTYLRENKKNWYEDARKKILDYLNYIY